MKILESYFFQTFLLLLLAIGAFFVFKKFLPARLFPETAVNADNIAVDSLMLEALAQHREDTLIAEPKERLATAPENQTQLLQEDLLAENGLYLFFKKLYELEQSKTASVRIAYFGDSTTEGDMIVQDIRKNYQSKYGGSGVGFVAISMQTPSMRVSIRHEFSENWKTHSFLTKSSETVGLSGYVSFQPDSTETWVKYKSGASPLANPVLLYGRSTNDSASVTIEKTDGSSRTIALQTNKFLNSIRLNDAGNDFTLRFKDADSIPFYGVDFTNKKGVFVDNFASRGNSGLPLSTFSASLMNAFDQILAYDLIVLHYGANVLSSKMFDYSWYTARMGATVKHLQTCFPNAAILVVSMADKATKYGTEMKTDSALVSLINAQRLYASKSSSAFMNLFELMGGEGTIVEWANADPALAAKDYTHFSVKGAKKIADLIFGELEKEYEEFKEQYKLQQTLEQEEEIEKENHDE